MILLVESSEWKVQYHECCHLFEDHLISKTHHVLQQYIHHLSFRLQAEYFIHMSMFVFIALNNCHKGPKLLANAILRRPFTDIQNYVLSLNPANVFFIRYFEPLNNHILIFDIVAHENVFIFENIRTSSDCRPSSFLSTNTNK